MAKRSKGAPGIYELEPGLYKVVISLGRDSTGRYRQHARTVRGTMRDAKALRSRALTEATDRKVIARADVTFGALLERWLEHLETLGRSPTPLPRRESRTDAIEGGGVSCLTHRARERKLVALNDWRVPERQSCPLNAPSLQGDGHGRALGVGP